MALSIAENAAAGLPEIEETNEVWAEADEMETMPDHGKEPEPKLEAAPEPDADEETVPPVAEAEAEAEAEPPAAELTEEQRKAAAFDRLSESATRNPVGLLRDLMVNLTPEQRAELGIAQAPAPQEAALWPDEEDTTAAERYIKTKAGLINDLPRWSQGVQNAVSVHERALVDHDASLAAMNAKLDAVALAMGLDLPAPKSMADAKARADYAAETKAAATRLKLVTTSKETATPKTPRNGSGGGADAPDLTPKANESFQQLFRRVAAASRS